MEKLWKWIIKMQYGCAGSLIHPHWIATAGHCCPGNNDNLSQFAFSYKVYDKYDNENEIRIIPSAVIQHPQYDGMSMNNDICLLYVEEAIPFDSDTSNICLPPKDTLATRVEPGTNCFVAGWGRTSENGYSATTLKELKIPIISHEKCNGPGVYNGWLNT